MKVEDIDIDEQFISYLKGQGIESLYPPQAECIDKGLLEGKNLVVAIPTASGKTLIAMLAIFSRISRAGGKAVYLAPLRALASEKYDEFTEAAKAMGLRVAIASGDYESGIEWLGSRDIIIATNEKFDSIIRHQASWLNDISVIVSDEVHLINDSHRGPVLEVVLSQIRQKLPSCQVIALSATIKNAEEIADWLEAELVLSDWRPVSLKEGVWVAGDVFWSDRTVEEIGSPNEKHGYVPLAIDAVQKGGQCLVFAGTRSSVVQTARKISSLYYRFLTSDEKRRLKELSNRILKTGERTQLSQDLASIVERGVAFHHAGLLNAHRKLIEKAFRSGLLKIIAASPTLCFAPGTKIRTSKGLITVERLYQLMKSNEEIKIPALVNGVLRFVVPDAVVKLPNGESLVQIQTVSGRTITTTPGHRFLVNRGEFECLIPAKSLKERDSLRVRPVPHSEPYDGIEGLKIEDHYTSGFCFGLFLTRKFTKKDSSSSLRESGQGTMFPIDDAVGKELEKRLKNGLSFPSQFLIGMATAIIERTKEMQNGIGLQIDPQLAYLISESFLMLSEPYILTFQKNQAGGMLWKIVRSEKPEFRSIDLITKVSRIDGCDFVYDIALPDNTDHLLVTEGIVSHNSAGVNTPSRRVVIRTLSRYSDGYNQAIPVLEYKQMAGRAGRPRYDPYGEAIVIARNLAEKDEIMRRYIEADTEEIYSKFGSEPSLRTHLLSFVVSGDVQDFDSALDMISTTFFGYQNEGQVFFIEELVHSTLDLLVEAKLISAKEPYKPTPFGFRVNQLYLDPLTALTLKKGLMEAPEKDVSDIVYLHLIASTPDIRNFYVREKEMDGIIDVADSLIDELLVPDRDDLSWDFFLQEIKTAKVLQDWISEKSESEIHEKYNVTSGDLHNLVSNAEWLLHSAAEIARLFKMETHEKRLRILTMRVKYGISEQLIPLTSLNQIGRKRARLLFMNGIKKPADVLKASKEKLAQLLGPKIAESILYEVRVGKPLEIEPESLDFVEEDVPEIAEEDQTTLDDFF